MKWLVHILLLIILLTACGTAKDIRRSNRAARKLERLVEKYPELRRTDTLLVPIHMRTPVIHGSIVQPMLYPVPGETRTITLPGEPVSPGKLIHYFDDQYLTARVELDAHTGMAALDYTIKPIPIDTIVKVEVRTVQSTVYRPMPLKWWQGSLMGIGALALIVWLIMIAIALIQKQLNKQ